MAKKKRKKHSKPMPPAPVQQTKAPAKLNRKTFCVAALAVLAIITVAVIIGMSRDKDDGPDTYGTWYSEELKSLVSAEIDIKSTGDNVTFAYNDKDYTLPNTDIIFWEEHNKRINPEKYNSAYWFTVTYIDGSAEDAVCYEYKDDPACKDNPAYLIYTEKQCYHISKDRVEFRPIDKEELTQLLNERHDALQAIANENKNQSIQIATDDSNQSDSEFQVIQKNPDGTFEIIQDGGDDSIQVSIGD